MVHIVYLKTELNISRCAASWNVNMIDIWRQKHLDSLINICVCVITDVAQGRLCNFIWAHICSVTSDAFMHSWLCKQELVQFVLRYTEWDGASSGNVQECCKRCSVFITEPHLKRTTSPRFSPKSLFHSREHECGSLSCPSVTRRLWFMKTIRMYLMWKLLFSAVCCSRFDFVRKLFVFGWCVKMQRSVWGWEGSLPHKASCSLSQDASVIDDEE